jgi:hypothetical protein
MAIGTAAAIIGGAIIGGAASTVASNNIAGATEAGFDAANAEQGRQFDLTRSDTAEQRRVGDNALGRADRLQSGDLSEFFASPGYEFVRGEGTRDIGNTFAAKGSGGNALRALAQFNSGLASNELNNFFNRDLALAGLGAQGINTAANAGVTASTNISNNAIGEGNARASGIAGQNAAFQGTLSNLITASRLKKPNPRIPPSDPDKKSFNI